MVGCTPVYLQKTDTSIRFSMTEITKLQWSCGLSGNFVKYQSPVILNGKPWLRTRALNYSLIQDPLAQFQWLCVLLLIFLELIQHSLYGKNYAGLPEYTSSSNLPDSCVRCFYPLSTEDAVIEFKQRKKLIRCNRVSRWQRLYLIPEIFPPETNSSLQPFK